MTSPDTFLSVTLGLVSSQLLKLGENWNVSLVHNGVKSFLWGGLILTRYVHIFFKVLTITILSNVIWQFGLSSFQWREAKLLDVWPKIYILEGNYCTKLSESAKIWFSKSIFNIKNHPKLYKKFFCWRISI